MHGRCCLAHERDGSSEDSQNSPCCPLPSAPSCHAVCWNLWPWGKRKGQHRWAAEGVELSNMHVKSKEPEVVSWSQKPPMRSMWFLVLACSQLKRTSIFVHRRKCEKGPVVIKRGRLASYKATVGWRAAEPMSSRPQPALRRFAARQTLGCRADEVVWPSLTSIERNVLIASAATEGATARDDYYPYGVSSN